MDFEAYSAFSMFVSSQKLFEIGTRALVVGNEEVANLFFDFSSQLVDTYERLKRLVWNHPLIGKYITDARKAELDAELVHSRQARKLKSVDSSAVVNHIGDLGDLTDFLKENFRNYDHIVDHPPTDEEIALLMSLDEVTLRSRVARTLALADPVLAQREAKKTHGPVELADIVVRIEFQGRVYSLCLPFKSGREYGKAKSIPSSMTYQVWRPHMFLTHAVVILISAKPCSENLQNDIRQSRDRLGWPIEVIQHEALASLLKVNGLLH